VIGRYSAATVLPPVGTTKLLKAQNLCQSLLGECLFGENSRHSIGSLFTLRRVQQSKLLHLAQWRSSSSSVESPGHAASAWQRTCCNSETPSMQ